MSRARYYFCNSCHCFLRFLGIKTSHSIPMTARSIIQIGFFFELVDFSLLLLCHGTSMYSRNQQSFAMMLRLRKVG